MASLSRPRRGSLQYWPRKRAEKVLPSVNWNKVKEKNSDKKILGVIGYKASMKSAFVKDNTPDSLSKGKRICIPVTIIECPQMKIFSVRFYKKGIVQSEILNTNVEKEIKKRVKTQKKDMKKIEDIEDYDDIRLIVYSLVKKTGIKKKPDLTEIALGGNVEDKLNFVKENLNKEISVKDIFEPSELIDTRGNTKGKGIQGPVKRFGITLRQHKAEKGQRKVGSIGPWHPARTTFRVPMAGQMGYFSRITYNNKIIFIDSISNQNINPGQGFKKYGNIKTDYVVVAGSIQGPAKRQLILSPSLRPTKKQSKKNYEFIELR